MNYKAICFATLFLSLSFLHINAQSDRDSTEQIGGFYKEQAKKSQLDKAQLSVLYQYRHEIVNNKDISFVIDTMTLVAGPQFSIYFDRNEISRRKSFSSYFSRDGQPLAWQSLSIGDFTMNAIDDNKLFSPPVSGETYQLYKDRKENFVTVMDFDNSTFADELYFFYEEEMSPINWEIKDDTTMVLGYTCIKATCDFEGRNYTAWFTQDIPINDGPYKFYGLPGIILKIEDSEGYFQFEAIGLEKMGNAEIVMSNKANYQKSTKEEYKRLKKRAQENFTVFYRSGKFLYFSNKKIGIERMPIEKDVNR